ncbi:hypothetical protein B0H21DRAFT_833396 [Amylocystis lapponica]|nr:hypothetical protein B0H21DRAFT_833396 [Amylocystis lapponica]
MAPVTNGRYLFKEIPQLALPIGFPEPGKTMVYDTSETIDLENVPLDGGFLVKTLVLSIDPYMRGRMREPHVKGYVPPYLVGEPLRNFGIGVVLRSEHASAKTGEHIYGEFPFQQYWTSKEPIVAQNILKNEEKLPWSVYLGVLGMPGQTAHHGWNEYAHAKKGDVAFVTTGAGPVGATVIQLAKADGVKVIASAGSDEKVAFMKSLGADVAFNYKTTDPFEVLQKEGPINIFWDNVGGAALEAAIANAAVYARFIECGMITAYNGGEPYVVKNLHEIFAKELKLSGFVVISLWQKYLGSFYADFPARVARGEIKYTEEITEGLENAGKALLDVQMGRNKAKSVILVARE